MPLIITPGHLARRGDFYFQLSSLVTAGVPIIQAFEMLKNNSASRGSRQNIEEVIRRLNAGATLNEALRSCPHWLPEFDLSLISAGEISGRLEMVLKMLGGYYTEQSKLISSILSALAYPIFILHLAVIVFPTSYLTGLMVAGGPEAFLRQKLAVLIPVYIGIFVLLVLCNGRFGKTWGRILAAFASAVPVLGSARRNLGLARFSAAMEALVSAGVPIINCWDIASTSTGSAAINHAVQRNLPRMNAGVTPAEALQNMTVFPELFRNLYTSGEVSGSLDQALKRLYDYYQEQASNKFRAFGQWTPKIIFLFIAIAIGWQIISFYTNYFGQIGNL